MDCAHRHNVLHRDLKPGNVLVEVDSGRLCVTDFGLAKCLAENEGMTETGDVLGTPNYMSPEQAAGRNLAVGPGTDVYGLGAIFYELLTGRPPFRGENRVATLRQVMEAEPVSPRLLNPGTPRDLETICLKCLEKETLKRYPTAGGLADDLDRFLDGRPILARPISRPERLVRWCRRNPWLAGLCASILIGVTLVFWQWTRAEREAKAVRIERDTANQERQNAEAHLAQAVDAVDFIGRKIGYDQLRYSPQSENIRREMTEYALRFYEGYLTRYGGDRAFREEATKTYARVADLRAQLGDSAGAEIAFHKSIELAESMAADVPDVIDHRLQVSAGWMGLGNLLMRQGRLQNADEAFRHCEEIGDSIPAEVRAGKDYRNALAATYYNRMLWFHQTLHGDKGEALGRKALELYEQLAGEFPNETEYKIATSRVYNTQAIICAHSGRGSEALPLYLKALEMQEQAVAMDPLNPGIRASLGLQHRNLAKLHRTSGRTVEAAAAYERAYSTFERLATDFPETPLYHRELAEVLMGQCQSLTASADWPKKESLLARAVEQQRRAAALEPNNAQDQRQANNLVMIQSQLFVDEGKYRAAVDRLADLPDVLLHRYDVDVSTKLLAQCAKMAENDPKLSPAERLKRRRRLHDDPRKYPAESEVHRFENWRTALDDPELGPLRSHLRLQELVKQKDETSKQAASAGKS